MLKESVRAPWLLETRLSKAVKLQSRTSFYRLGSSSLGSGEYLSCEFHEYSLEKPVE